jgi:hypothetical protein
MIERHVTLIWMVAALSFAAVAGCGSQSTQHSQTKPLVSTSDPPMCQWSSTLSRWVKVAPSADEVKWIRLSNTCVPDPADANGNVGGDTSHAVPGPNRGENERGL